MKSSYIKIVFLIGCLLIAGSCSAAKTQSTGEAGNANVPGSDTSPVSQAAEGKTDVDKSIRKVDFKNFTYEPFCVGDEPIKVTVKNGEFSKETKQDDYVDRFYFHIEDPVYGDLDGDNSEEAIVLSVCNTGGTGNFSEGFVFTMKNGKPSLLTRIEGGDRAYGGLRSAKVEYGFVDVERNDVGEDGGACCPEFLLKTKYKWNGKELAKWGDEVRRELYPAQRVTFPKGSSKTALKISVEDIKRYVVGARSGQTLSVAVNSSDVSLSLRKGEADVTEGMNGFTARLKANGDYVIQLQNIGSKATEVTVTIEIR